MGSNVPRSIFKPGWTRDSPCLGCGDRSVGCHGKCERYAQYKAEGLEDWKKRRDTYTAERNIEGYEVAKKVEMAKKKHKR